MKNKIISAVLVIGIVLSVFAGILRSAAASDDVDSTGYFHAQLTNGYQRQFYDYFVNTTLADIKNSPNGTEITLDPALTWSFVSANRPTQAEIEAEKSSVDALTSIGNDIKYGFSAALMDRPDDFWLNSYTTSYSYSASYGKNYADNSWKTTVTVSSIILTEDLGLFAQYGLSVDDLSSFYDELRQDISSYVKANSSLFESSDRYRNVKTIHDYVISKLSYSDEHIDDPIYHTAVTAVTQNSGVCETYAEYFKLLLEASGIPCVLVSGTAINGQGSSENHEWCEVQMDDGKWYMTDPTWDDQDAEVFRNKYFLIGYDKYNSLGDHSSNTAWLMTSDPLPFIYPALAKDDYAETEGSTEGSEGSGSGLDLTTTQASSTTGTTIQLTTVSTTSVTSAATTTDLMTTETQTSQTTAVTAAQSSTTAVTASVITTATSQNETQTTATAASSASASTIGPSMSHSTTDVSSQTNSGSDSHSGSQVTGMKGDLDNDSKITASDARLALRLAVGLDTADDDIMDRADVDGDGQVTSADARLILRVAISLDKSF